MAMFTVQLNIRSVIPDTSPRITASHIKVYEGFYRFHHYFSKLSISYKFESPLLGYEMDQFIIYWSGSTVNTKNFTTSSS